SSSSVRRRRIPKSRKVFSCNFGRYRRGWSTNARSRSRNAIHNSTPVMAVTYKVINEENFPLFYAFFSSLAAMKLQPIADDSLLLWHTRDEFFTLNYDTVLQSVDALRVETEEEDDGRWIAEIPSLPGVLAYGDSVHSAIAS